MNSTFEAVLRGHPNLLGRTAGLTHLNQKPVDIVALMKLPVDRTTYCFAFGSKVRRGDLSQLQNRLRILARAGET